MLLKVSNFLSRHRQTEQQLHQTAFQWRYSRFHDCRNDIAEFRLHGVVQSYVSEYVDAMDAKEESAKG